MAYVYFSGLIYFPEGALNVDGPAENLSEMFRPFHHLLIKIRDLLRVLTADELRSVELALCSGDSSNTSDHGLDATTFTMSDFRQRNVSSSR